MLILAGCSQNQSRNKRFTLLAPRQTGIDFINRITDNDTLNIIRYLYFYNGGGVAAGDINNDGLPDLFFTGNLVENKLYLNLGNFRFRDITRQAGLAGSRSWTTGVTMADVNGDGWLDLYVCEVGGFRNLKGRNRLYINNGNLTFTEKAKDYNLAFSGFGTHASFFDYDRDGDLDVYLLNHSVHANYTLADMALRYTPDDRSGDRLMRNDNGVFTDVTREAGILTGTLGYGLSVAISDFNTDGWPDIYVCNDFRENDYLYLNQRNGTFKQIVEKAMPHTSRFSMGSDAADINNDLKPDLITLDMLPDDEVIRKRSAGEDSYEIFQHKLSYGFHYQFSRNALQLNRGEVNGIPLFSDIAPFAGVEATDWSWAALFADFNNDGFKDLFISNGVLRRPNDLDYISYIASTPSGKIPDLDLAEKMPAGQAVNRMFQNTDGLHFKEVTRLWMDDATPNCAQGATYADLDLDGDLDLVVNVQNMPALIYRNNTSPDSAHYLRIRLQGKGKNVFAIGAGVEAYAGGNRSFYEVYTSRGWQSAVEPIVHIGLGSNWMADSVIIRWPDGQMQKLFQVGANKLLEISQVAATPRNGNISSSGTKFFKPITIPGLSYSHSENKFSAINHEPLLPFSHAVAGPPLAVADINGDDLDDLFIGGAAGQSGVVFVQQPDGSFKKMNQPDLEADAGAEDTACALADVNNDGLADLIVAGGGQQFNGSDVRLKPRLYLNKGNGMFTRSDKALPEIFADASVIRIADFNQDNLPDIFLGGRVVAKAYGKVPDSFVLRNNGDGTFSDVTLQLFATRKLGRIQDACWTDVNHDRRPDLLLAGYWMPLTVWIQQPDGKFADETQQRGLKNTSGLWNVISTADINHDSLPDFIAGNFGLNSRLRASSSSPVIMYVNDFDANGTEEQILIYNTPGGPSVFNSRDQLVKQIPSLKKKFLSYANYSKAGPDNVFETDKLKASVKLETQMLGSAILRNNGSGFDVLPLPDKIQFFPVFALAALRSPAGNSTMLLAAGNLTDVQPDIGFLDAGYGELLEIKPDFSVLPIPPEKSGFIVPGQARHIGALKLKKGHKNVILVSRNNQTLLAFTLDENY
ncbi:MAG: hypothetical protein KatS3mg032_0274 [Cyclobacteriaceae bacterium]|nr:MAG: hypothetical protein KatS3mg032_0274 [Cyclobacteriaceae bacterium]